MVIFLFTKGLITCGFGIDARIGVGIFVKLMLIFFARYVNCYS
jgi:hypothetical protein